MDPVSLILGALVAGGTKGVGEAAAAAVKEAYAGLRDALRWRLRTPEAQKAVEEYTADPDNHRLVLEAHLKQAGADADPVIVRAAEAVMAQADPAGSSAGKYLVDLRGAQGVQVGERNTQANYFGSGPN
jgi:hypothetical protein